VEELASYQLPLGSQLHHELSVYPWLPVDPVQPSISELMDSQDLTHRQPDDPLYLLAAPVDIFSIFEVSSLRLPFFSLHASL
jgi:hypothetical protein